MEPSNMRHLFKQNMLLACRFTFVATCLLMGTLEATLWYNPSNDSWWEDADQTIGVTTKIIKLKKSRVKSVINVDEGTKLLKTSARLDERESIFNFADTNPLKAPFNIREGAVIGDIYNNDRSWLKNLFDEPDKAELRDFAIASKVIPDQGFKQVTLSTDITDPNRNIGIINERRQDPAADPKLFKLPVNDQPYDVLWDGATTYLLQKTQYEALFDNNNQDPSASPQP